MLSLNQIAPKWSDYLLYGTNNDQLDIFSTRKCIVGEAWGFKKKYIHECVSCSDYSKLLMISFGKPGFMGNLASFIVHWNNEH